MAPPNFQGRLVRVLTVLRLIGQDPGEWSRARLAERMRVSERALDNDFRAIRAAGYHLRRHRKAYVLDEDEL